MNVFRQNQNANMDNITCQKCLEKGTFPRKLID